jgi:hypothetical protein
MTIVTTRYVRNPLYVDAVQITADNFAEVAHWCQGQIRLNAGGKVVENTWPEENSINPRDCHIRVRVHNPRVPRQTKGFVGDWLLYTEMGYKVYSQQAFEGSFSEVKE